MKLVKDELMKALKAVKPGISPKEIIQQATHVMFMGNCIATFNDAISVLYPFKTDFKCSVNGDEFYKVLEGIKESEVEITFEKDQIKINSKKTKAGFSTLVGENEKVEPTVEKIMKITGAPKFFRSLPKDFVKGISLCMFSASKDMTSGVNSCVAVKDDKVYSTDRLRLSRFTLSNKVKDEMLIPARDTFDLVKYDVTKYGMSEGWIHFQTDDGVIFNCRTMKGEYPFSRIDSFFHEKLKNEIKVPNELKEVMINATVLAAGEIDINKMVEVVIEKGKITCKSEKERGWMTKQIDCSYKGNTVSFVVNPIFMSQVLESATTISVVQGKQYPDKCYFTQEGFQHAIALPTPDEKEK